MNKLTISHHVVIAVLISLFLTASSQFTYLVYSATSTGIRTEPASQAPYQLWLLELSTYSPINVSINVPSYVLVEMSTEVKLFIDNKADSNREISLRVESTFKYVEIIDPAHEITLSVPPRHTYTVSIFVRGRGEGEEILVITVMDLTSNYTHKEVVRLQVTSLRTVYIYAYGIINVFTFELYRKPVELSMVQLCNFTASHISDNVYMVQVPKIYKECTLYYAYPWLEDQKTVSLAEDTINLIVVDTASNFFITVLAMIMLFPALLIIITRYTEEFDDAIVWTIIIWAFLASTAYAFYPLFIYGGLGLLFLVFALIVILSHLGSSRS